MEDSFSYELRMKESFKTLTYSINQGFMRIFQEIERKKIKNFSISEEDLLGYFIACDIIDESTGKIFYEAGYEIDEDFRF